MIALKQELAECSKKRKEIMDDLVKSAMNDSLNSSPDLPYLKQIYRALLALSSDQCGENPYVTTLMFKLLKTDTGALRKCLKDKTDTQYCVNLIIDRIKTGKIATPSVWLSQIFKLLEKISLWYVVYLLVAISFLILAFYWTCKFIRMKKTLLGTMFLIGVLSMAVSVPWEWMRMYRKELAKKSSKTRFMPEECSDNLGYTAMVKWWIRDTFYFSDGPCLEYYDAAIVDPLWEVTPAQVS